MNSPQHNPSIHPELEEHIRDIAIVDTHEHQCTEKEWVEGKDTPGDVLSNLFVYYIKSDMIAAGCSPEAYDRMLDGNDPDIEGRWNGIKDIWERVRLDGYGEATTILAREVFGIEEITPQSLAAAQPKLDALRKPGGRYLALRDMANLDHIQIQDCSGRNYAVDETAPRFFLNDIDWTDFCFGKISAAHLHKLTAVEVRDADSLREAMEAIFNRYGKMAVAVKAAHAYERTLLWKQRTDEEIEPLLGKQLNSEELSYEERVVLGDWCMACGAELCAAHNLPMKIHTGYLGGNWIMPAEWIPAGNLSELVHTYRNTNFIVMHIAWPYQGEAIAMAKHFANVYVDMCWAWTISPRGSMEFMREYLHAAPIHKLFGFGGDVFYPLGPVAYAIQARRWITRALAAEIADGDLTLRDAMDTATRVLRGNQYELLDIVGAQDAAANAPIPSCPPAER